MPQDARKKPPRRFVRKTKAVRQEEIIAATMALIGKYGVQGTTVSRIAQAVGIARGALYQHFPNREAVLEAALDAWREQSSAWMSRPDVAVPAGAGPAGAAPEGVPMRPDTSASEDIPVLEQLLRMGKAHSDWAVSPDNTFVRPFFQLIASNRESSLTTSIIKRQQDDFQRLVDLAEAGKREGSIGPEVESGDVAWSLLLHAWGEDIARLIGVDRFITEGASTRILERLLTSYAAEERRTAAG
jgi:AcrR family transcriptional regulator